MRKSVFDMSFPSVYQALINKAEKKGRRLEEVLEVTSWLLGYTTDQILDCMEGQGTYGDFLRNAPKLNEKRDLVKGKICGIQIENIEDPLTQEMRRLDKLVDELTKGKSLEKILYERK